MPRRVGTPLRARRFLDLCGTSATPARLMASVANLPGHWRDR